jgi:hypothetical protein
VAEDRRCLWVEQVFDAFIKPKAGNGIGLFSWAKFLV